MQLLTAQPFSNQWRTPSVSELRGELPDCSLIAVTRAIGCDPRMMRAIVEERVGHRPARCSIDQCQRVSVESQPLALGLSPEATLMPTRAMSLPEALRRADRPR
jgi:hypothetical protein